MQGINQILQRMSTIQQRFQISPRANGDFSKILANEQANHSNPSSSSAPSNVGTEKNFATNDISKMIQFAAQKYGVDPKLAMAVAKVESNLQPDAVSEVGAEGVMQLMPETAQGLGVRNNKDPRENIDGGIRYLKQLMASFGGDVTKTVAAYNAGPQAVERYNGTPPYSETQAYVTKVMALYKS